MSYLKKKNKKKSLNSFLVYFGFHGLQELLLMDMGIRKRRESNLFYLLMSSTFSFGGRMRFGKLVGEIQPIRESLNKAGSMALTSSHWEQS